MLLVGIQMLLETAANTSLRNGSGQTAHQIAELAGRVECARVLESYSRTPVKSHRSTTRTNESRSEYNDSMDEQQYNTESYYDNSYYSHDHAADPEYSSYYHGNG